MLKKQTKIIRVPLHKIQIPQDSVRSDLKDINELAISIKTSGLINPILLDSEYKIISGLRRYLAVKHLKHKIIEAQFFENLSEFDKLRIKIEEQLGQKRLKWYEEVLLKLQLHNLYVKEKKKGIRWTQKRTAKILGIKYTTLSEEIRLAKNLEIFPALKKLPTKTEAIKQMYGVRSIVLMQERGKRSIAKKKLENEKTAKLVKQRTAELESSISDVKSAIDDSTLDIGIDVGKDISAIESNIENSTVSKLLSDIDKENNKKTKIVNIANDIEYIISSQSVKKYNHILLNNIKIDLLQMDGCSLMRLLPENSIDLIITEPPSELSEETYIHLLYKVLKPQAHLYLFFNLDKDKLHTIYTTLCDMKFDVQPTPCIWVKERPQFTKNWQHTMRSQYECFFFVRKLENGESKKLARPTSTIFTYKRPSIKKRIHIQEKPIALIRNLIKLSSDPNDIVFDPFAGSASTLLAAIISQRHGFGSEINSEIFQAASGKLDTMIQATISQEERKIIIKDAHKRMQGIT